MLKLIEYKNPVYLSEENQFFKARFSFVQRKEDVLTEITQRVLCRDFLGDVLYAEEQKLPIKIYGFSHNPENCLIDRDMTRLLLSNLTEEIRKNISKNILILTKIEKFLGLSLKTHFVDVENCILIEASPYWLQSTIHLSFYTFLLRCLFYTYKTKAWRKELAALDTTETTYIRKIGKRWRFFLQWLKDFTPENGVTGWSSKRLEDENTYHSSSGFVSLITSALVYNPDDNIYGKEFRKALQLQKQGGTSEVSGV